MNDPEEIPTATLERRRGTRLAWILPLLTLASIGLIARGHLAERGPRIVIELELGHGLQEGDAVRYRGIDVGRVRSIHLADDLGRVEAEVELAPHARSIARRGSRFWVERPRIGPSGVSGLETLVGARYLGVDPGPPQGQTAGRFTALEAPPVEPPWGAGFEVRLEAPTRGGVAVGAPILYRSFEVGKVIAVTLSSDASRVEFRASIDPGYADLIRERTRFWETSGLELEFDLLRGLRFELENLEALLAGGIALATPDDPGPRVDAGARFTLDPSAPDDWTRWRPDVPLGTALLPEGALLPRPEPATLRWRERGLFGRERSRSGWVLRVAGGLIGPTDLVCAPLESKGESARLELGARSVPARPERPTTPLALLADDGPGAAWPGSRVRPLTKAEELLVFADPSGIPSALASGRIELGADGLARVDGSVRHMGARHGAPVLARSDGTLVGLLLVDDEGARVAPIPIELR
jgi:paraquat-inducible protein B